MKVYIGDIVSVNSSEEVFRYLVEDAGRICYVGDVLPEKYVMLEISCPKNILLRKGWNCRAERFCRYLSIPISIFHHFQHSMPG